VTWLHPPYDYDRPPFGEFGAFLMVGDRLVCHLCGRDYLNLQTHVWAMHGLRASEYRDRFRLFVTTALWARPVSRRITESNHRRIAQTPDLMVRYSEAATLAKVKRTGPNGVRRPRATPNDLTRQLNALRSREWWASRSPEERAEKGRFLAARYAEKAASDPEIAAKRGKKIGDFWRGRKRTPRYGEASSNSKLTDVQTAEIRARLAAGEKGVDVAKRYGVSDSLVSLIRLRKVRVQP
jgi:hypothetical protein